MICISTREDLACWRADSGSPPLTSDKPDSGEAPACERGFAYVFGAFRLLPAERLLKRDGHNVYLGSRAFDLLLILVSRAGRLIGKEELLDLAWPGLNVEENNLAVQIHALRRALGDDRENRHIRTVTGYGYRFVVHVTTERAQSDLRTPLPAFLPTRVWESNLPWPVAPLVGREMDCARVQNALRHHQLVVITGAGGIGKSRVALQVGNGLTGDYPDGVWLAELAENAAPSSVEEAITALFGITVDPGHAALDALLPSLHHRRLLLILDNCEHVVSAVARLVHAVRRYCPGVSILATSRERLTIPGEMTIQLSPLSFPAHTAELTAAKALDHSSVELFVQRATALIDGFVFTDEEAPTIAEICFRLDGIPLAIELAVPCLRTLGPKELAARLDERLNLLTSGNRMALPHHRTLRASIGWSYDLLDEDERRLLRRLSIFVGGWTLRMAVDLAATAPVGDSQIIDLLSRLIDKSLVVQETLNRTPSYRLLESTRRYALERQRADGETSQADESWPTASTPVCFLEQGQVTLIHGVARGLFELPIAENQNPLRGRDRFRPMRDHQPGDPKR